MAEHFTNAQIENFIARRLSSDEVVATTRHLAVCSECRARVNAQSRTWARVALLQSSFRAEGQSTHLSYEQLAAYVDNDANDLEREISANHLAICSQCTAVVEELQTLRDRLQTPVAQPARKTFVEWLRTVWPAPALLRPVVLTATAVAVLLVIAIGWWWRRPAAVPEQNVAVAQPSPTLAPTVVAAASPAPVPAETPVIIASVQDRGGAITLNQAGNITGLNSLSKDDERALKQALTTQQLETPAELKSLLRRPATLMGDRPDAPAIRLYSPVGTFVQDTQPVLRWQAVAGAQSYTVTVLDTNFNAVATSPALAQPSWRVTKPLKRGQEYLWQVTADVNGQRLTSTSASAPEAHFKLLSTDQARALQALVQTNNSHLLRGTMYARAGLLDEAEREYQALLKANPQSTVARKLLLRVRGLRQ